MDKVTMMMSASHFFIGVDLVWKPTSTTLSFVLDPATIQAKRYYDLIPPYLAHQDDWRRLLPEWVAQAPKVTTCLSCGGERIAVDVRQSMIQHCHIHGLSV